MTTGQELRHLKERMGSVERHMDLLTEAVYPGMVELASVEGFARALLDHLKSLPLDERAMTDEQLDSATRRFVMRLRSKGEVPEKWSTVLARAMLSAQGQGAGNGSR
jgi:hypothetical protein